MRERSCSSEMTASLPTKTLCSTLLTLCVPVVPRTWSNLEYHSSRCTIKSWIDWGRWTTRPPSKRTVRTGLVLTCRHTDFTTPNSNKSAHRIELVQTIRRLRPPRKLRVRTITISLCRRLDRFSRYQGFPMSYSASVLAPHVETAL